MSATERPFENQQRPLGALISRRRLAIAVLLIIAVAGGIVIAKKLRGTDVERGQHALIEAFSDRRMIEPRLSGGFKGGEFKPSLEDLSGVKTEALEHASDLITDAAARRDPGADVAYARLLLSKSDKLPEALKYLRSAVARSPESAEVHNDLGVCFLQQNKIEDAIDEFEVALRHRPDMPEALFNRALSYQRLLLSEAARRDFNRAAEIEREPSWLAEVKRRAQELSNEDAEHDPVAGFDAALAEGDIDKARRLVNQSSEVFSRHAVWNISIRQLKAAVGDNQQGAALALSEMDLIGSVLIETRRNSLIADLAAFLRHIPDAQRRSELDLITAYVETLSRFQASQTGDTFERLQQLERQFRERGNNVFEALSAFQKANYCYSVKRFSESVRLLKDALTLVEQHEWPYNRASILNLLALQTSRLGQDSLAIKYFEQAISLCNESPLLEAQIMQYMSIPYRRLGDLDNALARLRDSTGLYLKNRRQPRLFANLAHNYSEVADIYRLRNKHALSLLYAKEALAYSRQAKDLKYAAEYSSFIAIEHARLNQLEEAEVELNHSFEYLKPVEQGRERDFTEALVLTNAGEVAVLSGDLSRALGYYEKAKALAASGEGNTLTTINVLRGRAAAYSASGQTDKAHTDLMGAVDLIEKYWVQIAASDQRSHFLDATHNVFDQLISLDATVLARPSEAFELSERARARSLLAEIGGKQPDTHLGVVDSQGSKPYNGSPTHNVSPLKLGEIQSYLDDDSMVLEYSVTNEGTFLFLITRSQFKLVQSAATTEILDRLVRDYISDLRRVAEEDELNDKAKALYDYLIKPVKEEVERKANVCIVPDKSLHFLPFAGLVDPSNNSYLVDSQLSLTYAPSASVLVKSINEQQSSKSSRPERMLAVGNPRLSSDFSDLPALVDAENEARQSASLYAPGSVVLVGEHATEQSVRDAIADCDVAHLALHCLVEESSPWLAALVLAGARPTGGSSRPDYGSAAEDSPDTANKRTGALSKALMREPTVDANDGFLYLNELYDIRLPHTRLVVLSACQSGLGQYYRGEGIVSLVRPFLAKGVPTVVASLWPVDSQATSELMIAFHRQRKLANKRTGEALHEAQLKIRQTDQFRHPFYWAPFVVVGANS